MELCPEVEGNSLGCTPLGSVEERIDHLVQRIGAVAHTGWVLCRAEEGSQGLVGSTLARHRTPQELRRAEREHTALDRRHLRKDRVLRLRSQLRLSQVRERIKSRCDELTSACLLLSFSLFPFVFR